MMRVSVSQAVALLLQQQVVALPTETVYGLAASLHALPAIERIFHLKGRPASNPLIIHVASSYEIDIYAKEYPPGFDLLAKAFWPGPLTLIIPIRPESIFPLVRAHLPTAAFRIPTHPLTRKVLQAVGPVVMPSANLSGKPSATAPRHVEDDFGPEFPVLNGGKCQRGIESTILHYLEGEWVILRRGSLEAEAFRSVLGYEPIFYESSSDKPLSPGQLFRHYAPRAKLILGDLALLPQAPCVLGFKERSYPPGKRIFYMGSLNSPEEVAENLYKILRQLDEEGISAAWVDLDFPRYGLWLTLLERLTRAGQSHIDDK